MSSVAKADKVYPNLVDDVVADQDAMIAYLLDSAGTVSVGSGDTHIKHLGDALVVGSGLSLSTLNPSANAQLQIALGSHTHAIGDVTNLQTTLDGKAASSHTHAISDVTGLQTALDGKAASSHTHSADDVTSGTLSASRLPASGVTAGSYTNANLTVDALGRVTVASNGSASGFDPASPGDIGGTTAGDGTFVDLTVTGVVTGVGISDVADLQTALDGKAASSHSHAISDVTGLQTSLDGKASSSHTHAIGDVTNLQTTLDGKAASSHTHAISDVTGLQTALDGKAASSHTHSADDVTSGTLSASRLPASGVTAGSYTNANLTVDALGRVTVASNGSASGFDPASPGDIGGTTAGDGTFVDLTVTGVVTGVGISDVADLQTALDGKAASSHSHAISDVTGLQTSLDGKASSSHTHAISDVTGLQTSLDGKAASSHTHAISDVTGLQTALDGKAASSHTHSADDVTSGTLSASRLPASGVTAGSYTNANLTVDALGRVTVASNGSASGFDPASPGDIGGTTAGDGTFVDLTVTGVVTGVGISDVADLQTALDGKAASSHSHAISDVTGLQTSLDGKASSSHTHAIGDVTNLQTTLDGKAASSHTHAISDVTGLQTALDGKAASSHTHSADDVTSGTLSASRLPASGVTAGSYTNANLTVDALGRVTVASNGSASGFDPASPGDIGGTTAGDGTFVDLTVTGVVTGVGISDVADLQTALDGKAASSHSHAISDVTGLQTSLDGKASSSHTHAISDVTGLQTSLDGKAASSHTHAISDVTGLQTALDGKAASSHTHSADDVTSGTLSASRLPASGVTAGSYTNANLTVDALGRVTVASNGSASGFDPASPGDIGGTTAGDGTFVDLTVTGVVTGVGISDVADLQTALDGKAASSHSHAISDVTGLQTSLDGKASSSHTHAISDVTGLQTSLDGKAASSHTHAISDVTGLQTALDGKAASSHTHSADDVTSGTLSASRLPASGVTAGSYTNANLTVDALGRVTVASNGGGGASFPWGMVATIGENVSTYESFTDKVQKNFSLTGFEYFDSTLSSYISYDSGTKALTFQAGSYAICITMCVTTGYSVGGSTNYSSGWMDLYNGTSFFWVNQTFLGGTIRGNTSLGISYNGTSSITYKVKKMTVASAQTWNVRGYWAMESGATAYLHAMGSEIRISRL